MEDQAIESRRSSRSSRHMTPQRRLGYVLGAYLVRAVFRLLTSTYRIKAVIGAGYAESFINGDAVCAPSYWHQHQLVCNMLFRQWLRRGFKMCFLMSASVDAEVTARIARAWGGKVARGSANQNSATLAMRDMLGMVKNGYSIVTTADGPRGPKHEFKAGVVVTALTGRIPILPIGCAADRAWYLNNWDKFMIPKPFSRIVLAIGKPYTIPSPVTVDDIELHRLNVQAAIMALMQESEDRLRYN